MVWCVGCFHGSNVPLVLGNLLCVGIVADRVLANGNLFVSAIDAIGVGFWVQFRKRLHLPVHHCRLGSLGRWWCIAIIGIGIVGGGTGSCCIEVGATSATALGGGRRDAIHPCNNSSIGAGCSTGSSSTVLGL